jgi:ssDNA-binding Zn-finger/Zn-ribbon topoisomerase 1
MADIKCPECGAPMVLKKTRKYLHRDGTPRLFYACCRYPKCRATHGAHPDGRPLGFPANAETKQARIKAHELFDQLWEDGKMNRHEAYAWLAEKMNAAEVHIGNMDKTECETVIKICSEYLEGKL